MEFSNGMRVVVLEDYMRARIANKVGTVIDSKINPFGDILIEFDEDMGGHNGQSSRMKGKDNHCWWCPPTILRLLNKKLRTE